MGETFTIPNALRQLSIVTGRSSHQTSPLVRMLSLLTVSPGSLSYYSACILLICDRLSRR